jgi:SAM-dependent methyltransferase
LPLRTGTGETGDPWQEGRIGGENGYICPDSRGRVMKKIRPDEVIDAYRAPETAAAYRDKYGRSPLRRLAARAEERLVRRALERAGVTGPILDAPCGTGRFLPVVARHGAPFAADASPDMLALARRARPDAAFTVAAYPHLPFADGAFPAVACLRFLHHVAGDDLISALGELARVSRGPIVASLFLTGNLQAARRARRDAERGMRRRFLIDRVDLAAAAGAAGLRVAAVRGLLPGISALHVVTLASRAPSP